MRTALAVLVLTVCSFAQTQGGLPTPVDAVISDASGQPGQNQIATPENIGVGDVVLVGFAKSVGPGCQDSPFTIADTLSNTWTTIATFATPGVSFTKESSQEWCSVITTGGSDTITVTPGTSSGCGYLTSYARFPASLNMTCNLDGGVVTNSVTGGGGGITSLSTNKTTTINGDVVWSQGAFVLSSLAPQWTQAQTISINNETLSHAMVNAGAPGTYTSTVQVQNGHQELAIATVALKPSAISVITTAFDNCANGVVCNQQLMAVGGAAASYTWSVTAGTWPTGCSNSSLNTSTGAIQCTPTQNGTFAGLTFQVSDGSNTSSKNLPLTVGAAFLTPSLRQFDATHTFNNGGGTITPFGLGVNCGSSVLALLVDADDTHLGEGWIQALSGTSNKYSATVGGVSVPVQKLPLIGGDYKGPIYGLLFGPFTVSGTFVMTGVNNQTASSALTVGAYEITNVQGAVDLSSINGAAVTADGSISTTVVTQEPNSFVATVVNSNQADTTVFTSPLTFLSNNFAYAIIGSASSNSLTATLTSHNGGCSPNCNNYYPMNSLALRPALANSCPSFTGAGEKRRRIFN